MSIQIAHIKLLAYVLQTDGRTDAEGRIMPRYFDHTEQSMAISLFRKVQEMLKSESTELVFECSEEEKTFIKKLLNIPFSIHDAILKEEFISLLDKENV